MLDFRKPLKFLRRPSGHKLRLFHLEGRRMESDDLAPLQSDLVQPWVHLVLEGVPQLESGALKDEVDVTQANIAGQEPGKVDVRQVAVTAD